MSAGLYGLIEADVIDLAALLTMILLAASAMAWAAMTFARPAQHMGKPELKTDEALRRIDISSIWPLQNAAEGGHSIPKRHHRSEEHTSELQSLMRISYAVFCLKKKKQNPQLAYKRTTI